MCSRSLSAGAERSQLRRALSQTACKKEGSGQLLRCWPQLQPLHHNESLTVSLCDHCSSLCQSVSL